MSNFRFAYKYTHTQEVPTTVWTLVHNLGILVPVVDCWIDDGGVMVPIIPLSVNHIDVNTATVTFSSTQFGIAYVC
jgi:hypothetical protein